MFSMISKRVIDRSVWRGARFLDRLKPGWDQHIDLPNVSVATYDSCVLGQLHSGNYQHGLAVLGLSPAEACRFGFDLFPLARLPSLQLVGSRSQFDYLDECWRRLINERRKPA
jgi:hypothetical protein